MGLQQQQQQQQLTGVGGAGAGLFAPGAGAAGLMPPATAAASSGTETLLSPPIGMMASPLTGGAGGLAFPARGADRTAAAAVAVAAAVAGMAKSSAAEADGKKRRKLENSNVEHKFQDQIVRRRWGIAVVAEGGGRKEGLVSTVFFLFFLSAVSQEVHSECLDSPPTPKYTSTQLLSVNSMCWPLAVC